MNAGPGLRDGPFPHQSTVMIYTQVSGPEGESRFEDLELLSPIAWEAMLISLQPVQASRTGPLHPEPRPTLATVLTGWIEITPSLGVTRGLGSSQAMVFLDTEDKGHAFAEAPEPTVLMIIRLQDGIGRPAQSDLKLPN